MIGLGIALAQPERRVLVITGDGEMLMGLSSLATVAVQQPKNLAIVVMDNERYGETRQQLTHTGIGTDLAAVARATGIEKSSMVRTGEQLRALCTNLAQAKGTQLAQIEVAPEKLPIVLPPRQPSHLKNRFRISVLREAALHA